jgi:hypothetical protein
MASCSRCSRPCATPSVAPWWRCPSKPSRWAPLTPCTGFCVGAQSTRGGMWPVLKASALANREACGWGGGGWPVLKASALANRRACGWGGPGWPVLKASALANREACGWGGGGWPVLKASALALRFLGDRPRSRTAPSRVKPRHSSAFSRPVRARGRFVRVRGLSSRGALAQVRVFSGTQGLARKVPWGCSAANASGRDAMVRPEGGHLTCSNCSRRRKSPPPPSPRA